MDEVTARAVVVVSSVGLRLNVTAATVVTNSRRGTSYNAEEFRL